MNIKRRWKHYLKKYLKNLFFYIIIFNYFIISQLFANSGEFLPLEKNNNINISENFIKIPDFKIVFQNPSYVLERNEQRNDYTCDNSKEECKVNFTLKTLEDKNISTKFICDINLGFKIIQKCNPNTVTFPEGNTSIVFKISDKNDQNNYKEKKLLIKNEKILNNKKTLGKGNKNLNQKVSNNKVLEQKQNGNENATEGGELENNEKTGTGTIENNNKNQNQIKEKIQKGTGTNSGEINDLSKTPEPIIEIQSGLEHSGELNIYNCKKEDCKINLTGISSFTGNFDEKDYTCLWNFGSGTFKTANTDKKCNPGYVDYGIGIFDIILKISKKEDENSFKISKIIINNLTEIGEKNNQNISTGTQNKLNTSEKLSNSGGNIQNKSEKLSNSGGNTLGTNSHISSNLGSSSSYSSLSNTSTINSSGNLKEIIIQSGLDEKNTCNSERCKINLQYENTSKETCIWDFGNAEFKEKYIVTCNPSFIYFTPGKHKISVKISENGILKGEKFLEIENIYLIKGKENNLSPKAKIDLQGIISNKFLNSINGGINNKIICKNSEKCYINLTGEQSSDPNNDKLKFYWDLGNGEYTSDKNPKGIWYNKGNYTVSLTVSDIFDTSNKNYFFIEIIGDIKTTEIQENNDILLKDLDYFKNLKIKSVLVNPKGKDNQKEYIELENTGIFQVNLKGIILDDIVGKGSKPFIFEENIILPKFESKKFYRNQTKIALNNNSDEVNLIYYNEKLDKISWNSQLKDDVILTKDNYKVLNSIVRTFYNLRNIQFDKITDTQKKLLFLYMSTEGFSPLYSFLYISTEDFSPLYSFRNFKIIPSIEKKKQETNKKIKKKLFNKYGDIFNIWFEKTYAKALTPTLSQRERGQNRERRTEEEQNNGIEQKVSKIKKNNNKKISFTKIVKKQKKSLKIYGKTIPNAKIKIVGMGDDIIINSDNIGKYEIKIHEGLKAGSHTLSFFVENKDGKTFAINRDKKIVFEEEYLQNMKKYYVSKNTDNKTLSTKKKNNIQVSPMSKNTNSNEKVFGYEDTQKNNKPKIGIIIANILTTIVVISLGFLILKKEKIF